MLSIPSYLHIISFDHLGILTSSASSIKFLEAVLTNVAGSLAGYYRRFIEGFLKIAKSMTKLTQKGVKFDWGEKEEAAFQLKKEEVVQCANSGST
ncbi:hypothetical protein Tco_1439504 [Tanacetum coccineum]